MGWLGWSSRQALRADVQVIELAMDGMRDLLSAVFGTGESESKKTPVTPERMKAFSRRHNRLWALKQQQGRQRQGQKDGI
jgi:hypothetical protein